MKRLLSLILILPIRFYQLSISPLFPLVPLHTHLQPVCHRSHPSPRAPQRAVAGPAAPLALPSLGRLRL